MVSDGGSRRSVPAMMISLNVTIDTEGGFDCFVKQLGEWAIEVGFAKCHRFDLPAPFPVVVAYK